MNVQSPSVLDSMSQDQVLQNGFQGNQADSEDSTHKTLGWKVVREHFL